MPQAARGTKRHCSHCGANFYDLDRTPIVCPKCHADYIPVSHIPHRLPVGRPSAARRGQIHDEPQEAEAFVEDEILSHEDDEESLAEDGVDDQGDDEADMKE